MAEIKIKIEQGILEGFTSTTSSGFEYNSYLGIPYAKPPVGDLRFKDPQQPDNWEGIRKATKFGDKCCQFDMAFTSSVQGSDDCLYLNVYVPSKNNSKKAVMFWIHGGGFSMGSGDSDMYGPQFLIEKDIILVTVNYRLGPLGFLCLHTPEVPGNAGMKDLVFALRWVQKNIEKFGGDPNNVTIFGESAGSAAVQYLMLSKMSKSLFKKAIMQSGSCLSSWAHIKDPEKVAFEFGKKVGLETEDKDELLKYLRSLPAEKIAVASVTMISFVDQLVFVPTVEMHFYGVEPFILSNPMKIIDELQEVVPFICGVTSKEGIMFLADQLAVPPKLFALGEAARYAEAAAKMILGKTDIEAEIVKKVERFYFPKGGDRVKGFVNLISDGFFNMHSLQSIRLLAKKSKQIYFYCFSYGGESNCCKMFLEYPFSSASHADELPYLFTTTFWPFREENFNDVMTRKRVVSMWTDFAKNGNPTKETNNVCNKIWKPFTENEKHCLDIDENLELIKNPFSESMNFWDELAKK